MFLHVPIRLWTLRLAAALAVAGALLGSGLTATSRGDLSGQIAAKRSAAAALKAQIDADSRQIAATGERPARPPRPARRRPEHAERARRPS